uniref:Uncharacterized protein n=1 Tax=Bicosoecida sp. CB-2014 TaxID=1486930 RepID=A0A7S1CDI3_9STRA|mmetsp:Transcript_20720/g.73157  ORF Transcript_20720/g.73157 Transcript_20720/m.73157 type:complete len:1220 (+) Transcript_20720:159-3818(+)
MAEARSDGREGSGGAGGAGEVGPGDDAGATAHAHAGAADAGAIQLGAAAAAEAAGDAGAETAGDDDVRAAAARLLRALSLQSGDADAADLEVYRVLLVRVGGDVDAAGRLYARCWLRMVAVVVDVANAGSSLPTALLQRLLLRLEGPDGSAAGGHSDFPVGAAFADALVLSDGGEGGAQRALLKAAMSRRGDHAHGLVGHAPSDIAGHSEEGLEGGAPALRPTRIVYHECATAALLKMCRGCSDSRSAWRATVAIDGAVAWFVDVVCGEATVDGAWCDFPVGVECSAASILIDCINAGAFSVPEGSGADGRAGAGDGDDGDGDDDATAAASSDAAAATMTEGGIDTALRMVDRIKAHTSDFDGSALLDAEHYGGQQYGPAAVICALVQAGGEHVADTLVEFGGVHALLRAQLGAADIPAGVRVSCSNALSLIAEAASRLPYARRREMFDSFARNGSAIEHVVTRLLESKAGRAGVSAGVRLAAALVEDHDCAMSLKYCLGHLVGAAADDGADIDKRDSALWACGRIMVECRLQKRNPTAMRFGEWFNGDDAAMSVAQHPGASNAVRARALATLGAALPHSPKALAAARDAGAVDVTVSVLKGPLPSITCVLDLCNTLTALVSGHARAAAHAIELDIMPCLSQRLAMAVDLCRRAHHANRTAPYAVHAAMMASGLIHRVIANVPAAMRMDAMRAALCTMRPLAAQATLAEPAAAPPGWAAGRAFQVRLREIGRLRMMAAVALCTIVVGLRGEGDAVARAAANAGVVEALSRITIDHGVELTARGDSPVRALHQLLTCKDAAPRMLCCDAAAALVAALRAAAPASEDAYLACNSLGILATVTAAATERSAAGGRAAGEPRCVRGVDAAVAAGAIDVLAGVTRLGARHRAERAAWNALGEIAEQDSAAATAVLRVVSAAGVVAAVAEADPYPGALQCVAAFAQAGAGYVELHAAGAATAAVGALRAAMAATDGTYRVGRSDHDAVLAYACEALGALVSAGGCEPRSLEAAAAGELAAQAVAAGAVDSLEAMTHTEAHAVAAWPLALLAPASASFKRLVPLLLSRGGENRAPFLRMRWALALAEAAPGVAADDGAAAVLVTALAHACAQTRAAASHGVCRLLRHAQGRAAVAAGACDEVAERLAALAVSDPLASVRRAARAALSVVPLRVVVAEWADSRARAAVDGEGEGGRGGEDGTVLLRLWRAMPRQAVANVLMQAFPAI